jgi:hypothetical protein
MFKGQNWVIYVCLLAIVGSAAAYADSESGIWAGILCGSFALFIAIITDLAIDRVIAAIKEDRLHETDIMIAEATGKAVYKAISEEIDKKK